MITPIELKGLNNVSKEWVDGERLIIITEICAANHGRLMHPNDTEVIFMLACKSKGFLEASRDKIVKVPQESN